MLLIYLFSINYAIIYLIYRPVNDNRASLLRSSTTVRKPVNERDMYIHLWKNYVTFAFRVVPPVPSPVVRCASPDLSLRYDRIKLWLISVGCLGICVLRNIIYAMWVRLCFFCIWSLGG